MLTTGRRRNWLTLLLIASLAFNVGVVATFGVMTYRKRAEPPDHGPRGQGHGRPDICKMLDLTEEQDAQMQASRRAMREEVRELRREIREENLALTDLIGALEPDRELIAAQLGKIASLREQMDRRVVEHFLDSKSFLEPAQHEMFNKMVRRAFSRGGPGGMGRDGHRGPRGSRGRGMRGSAQDNDD